uniref:YobH family protein n=1 Tax=Escherichia coli TaxID=562 RepID=UPI00358F20FC
MKTQPATGETYPKSDLFNKAARGTSTVQYLHTKSGFLGITDCPLLRKSNIVVDNG